MPDSEIWFHTRVLWATVKVTKQVLPEYKLLRFSLVRVAEVGGCGFVLCFSVNLFVVFCSASLKVTLISLRNVTDAFWAIELKCNCHMLLLPRDASAT